MLSPLTAIWDIPFREKAAGDRGDLGGLHEQPDGRGSLGQALEMLGRHRDRLLSTATT
jgi:hypothetical protein